MEIIVDNTDEFKPFNLTLSVKNREDLEWLMCVANSSIMEVSENAIKANSPLIITDFDITLKNDICVSSKHDAAQMSFWHGIIRAAYKTNPGLFNVIS